MANELVKASAASLPSTGRAASLPQLVERAGGAARFAWDEFFYAKHHNPHTQAAYQRAVRRFLAWAEAQGVELAAITPGMVGQYLVGLGGSAAKRNQHLAALRGFSASRVWSGPPLTLTATSWGDWAESPAHQPF